MDSSNLDRKTRELIISLAMDFRRAELRAQVYLSLLEFIEEQPENLASWHSMAERLIHEPHEIIKERIDAKVQPLVEYALGGLSDPETHALLDRLRQQHDDIKLQR